MDAPSDTIDRDIGRRVHTLRADAAMTLAALANRTGVSRAMLSRIERGESSPTAQLLNRVCAGLGVTLSALFASAEVPGSPLRRRREQPVWRDPGSGYLRRIVSPPDSGSPAEIVEVEFPAGAAVSFDDSHFRGVDQHVWVLDGAMEVTVGEETYRVDKGDCLHMHLDRAIRFSNPFGRPARYAVVLSRNGGAR
jgi:transcriptional regulator with XRE-family HTH domain